MLIMKAQSSLLIIIEKRVKILTICLALLTIGVISITAHKTNISDSQGKKPQTVTDIAVVSNGETTLFIADIKTKSIYYYKMPPSVSQQHISLDLFSEIITNPKIDEPSAIAVYNGKLFICERKVEDATVYQLDLKSVDLSSKSEKPITKLVGVGKPYILEPKSLAISDEGILAVGDDKLNDVVLFEPDSNYPKELRYKSRNLEYKKSFPNQAKAIDEPDRIGFTGKHLVVLDTNGGTLSVVNGQSSGEQDNTLMLLNKLLGSITEQITSVKDFAVLNGIYYIADEKKITAFAPFTSHKSFPVLEKTAEDKNHSAQSRITAGKDFVYVSEVDTQSILVVPRPVPVNINFELAPGKIGDSTEKILEDNLVNQRNALVNLYEHLYLNKLLPKGEIKAREEYGKNIRKFLIDEKVLFERPYPQDWFKLRDEEYIERLERLVCDLNRESNPTLCGRSRTLNTFIKQNQSITVPGGIEFEVSTTKSKVPLGNRTVYDHLKSRLLEEQLREITADSLFQINPRAKEIETAITRLNFIPSTQFSPALKPGTLITVTGGKEQIVGDWSTCIESFNDGVKGNSLDFLRWKELMSNTVEAVLPVREKQTISNDFLKKWNIEMVSADFSQIKSLQVDITELEKIRQKVLEGQCTFNTNGNSDVFVINSAIQTSGAKFKLLKNDNTKKISQNEWKTANLLGEISDDPDYSLKIDEPFYLGYTLLKVNLSQNVSEWSLVKEADNLRQNDKEYIFKETNKTLVLPATRWRLRLFLNAKDLYETESLREMRSTPGVGIFSEEVFPTQNTSLNLPLTEDPEIAKNRRDILSLIKYYPIEEGILKGTYIGIAETKGSVHPDNPDFQGVWYKTTNEENPIPTTWVPENENLVEEAAPFPVRDFNLIDDHGDHVSGLIASRGKTLPGIVPGVRLYLVDTSASSPASLEKQINVGWRSGLVRIYNFSFTFFDELTQDQLPRIKNFDNFKKKIRTDWKDSLFIMAAGNDGQNLQDQTLYPVDWAKELPNVIGVGAANADGNPLEQAWQCSPSKTCPGTNYGKSHVDIIAPGYKVISTVNKGYAEASGTSQATPIVSAAAAALLALTQGEENILNVKARLIYTADWLPQFEDKVWGGRLNFERAVRYPFTNQYVHRSTKDLYSFEFKDDKSDPLKLTIKNAASGESEVCAPYPRNAIFECDREIPFKNVLRLSRYKSALGGDLYRIVYLRKIGSGNGGLTFLRIIKDAQLDELTVPCEKLAKWQQASRSFIPEANCTNLKILEMLDDYTAELPSRNTIINF